MIPSLITLEKTARESLALLREIRDLLDECRRELESMNGR